MRTTMLTMLLLATALLPWNAALAGGCPPVPELSICRAEAGDLRAQLFLGLNAYWVGTRTGDFAPAIYWLRKAALGGSVPAMRLLGTIYETGGGRPFDRGAARTWYQRAADAGDEESRQALQRLGKSDEGGPHAK